MHGLMNNTKWRELLALLSSYQIYVQLKCVGDDFPLDVERADWIISNIEETTFVSRKLQYCEIDRLKIVTDCLPPGASQEQVESLFKNIRVSWSTKTGHIG